MIYEGCYGCLDFLTSFMAWWFLWIEIDYWITNTQAYWQDRNKIWPQGAEKQLSKVRVVVVDGGGWV